MSFPCEFCLLIDGQRFMLAEDGTDIYTKNTDRTASCDTAHIAIAPDDIVWPLAQAAAHGGKRENAGRKPIQENGERLHRHACYFTKEQMDWLKEGGPKIGQLVRECVDIARHPF